MFYGAGQNVLWRWSKCPIEQFLCNSFFVRVSSNSWPTFFKSSSATKNNLHATSWWVCAEALVRKHLLPTQRKLG